VPGKNLNRSEGKPNGAAAGQDRHVG
jgi:hypothetical protein